MKQEQIRDFTRRISQSNRSGLTVVTYEIILAYIDDAEACYGSGNYQGFRDALKHAQRSIDTLVQSLDFGYEISRNLDALYAYAKEGLAKAIIKNSWDPAAHAQKVLTELYYAFKEAAKTDHSAPLMHNTQQVYAGVTYGRSDLTEMFQDVGQSRGFLA